MICLQHAAAILGLRLILTPRLQRESEGTGLQPGTPVGWPRHPCQALHMFWLKVFWGPFALIFGLPKFGKPVRGNFLPLG